MKNFLDLSVDPRLKANLARAGFVTPTPVQSGALPPALEGRDILATAQTGTGKTLAFAIPIVERLIARRTAGIGALIVLPTRELAMQVYEAFMKISPGLSVPSALVVGGLSEYNQLMAIRRGARLIIATPGRLEDFIKRRLIDLRAVEVLVLDEADRMVDMGFLPQMRTIMQALPARRQSMCFSATMPAEVTHLVAQYLSSPVRVEVGSASKHADTVKLQVYEVSRDNKLRLLMRLLEIEPGSVLVFTRTKHGADKVVRRLVQSGINAAVIHGNRSQNQRIAALKGFQTGRFRVLIATDIAARGIHVDNIAHVINYDLPQVPEDFIHRVGRTGRADESGVATTFVTPQDRADISRIERLLKVSIARLPLPAGMPQEPAFEGYPAPRRSSMPRRGQQQSGYFSGRQQAPQGQANGQPHPLEALWQEYGRQDKPRRQSSYSHSYRHGRGDGPHARGASQRRSR